MEPTERAAYVQAMAACALIEALGMLSENLEAFLDKASMPHEKGHFDAVIEKYGVHNNAVLNWLNQS